MAKEEYQDFVLRYKGCGACFPMYHTLSRFEKMWFTAIQKDVAELEKENAELKEENEEMKKGLGCETCQIHLEYMSLNNKIADLEKENAELKADNEAKDIQIKELQEQKCYWKESSFGWRHKFFKKDEVKRLVKKDKQLSKAKEIIKKFLLWENDWHKKSESKYELLKKAENFLKEKEGNYD